MLALSTRLSGGDIARTLDFVFRAGVSSRLSGRIHAIAIHIRHCHRGREKGPKTT